MKIIVLPLLIFGISFSQGTTFDPFYLNDESRSSVERAGDLFAVAIPLAGLGVTYYLDDKDGRKQFWSSYITSLSTTYLLKYSINKTRPNGDCCESFPSGHTASAFSGAMFIQNRYGSKYGVPSLLLASFVGYSRVEAEKHYWEDVIAGALISTLTNFIFSKQSRYFNDSHAYIGYLPYSNQFFLKFSFK